MAETQEGFKYIIARPVILGLTVMEAVSSVFGLDHTMLTIFASDVLRVGAQGFGMLQSARGLGAVALADPPAQEQEAAGTRVPRETWGLVGS